MILSLVVDQDLLSISIIRYCRCRRDVVCIRACIRPLNYRIPWLIPHRLNGRITLRGQARSHTLQPGRRLPLGSPGSFMFPVNLPANLLVCQACLYSRRPIAIIHSPFLCLAEQFGMPSYDESDAVVAIHHVNQHSGYSGDRHRLACSRASLLSP
jgi:hypothetical protein